MMTAEETKVLAYLRRQPHATLAEVTRACLPGASREWVDRVVANLNWLGYITVYRGRDGEPAALQITGKGRPQR